MKILMSADPIGGVWTYALELAAALRARAEVLLATLGAPLTSAQRAEVAALPHVRLEESLYRLEWMPEPWDDLSRAGHWLLALERAFKPDLVHLNHLVHGNLSWRAPVLVVGHSCVLSWWAAVRGGDAPPEWNRYRTRVTGSLRAADVVVAPTRTMLTALQRLYGPFGQAIAIANGLHARRFHTAPKEPFILAAGRLWDEAKNVGVLTRIAPSVSWPIFVAGAERSPGGEESALDGTTALGHLTRGELASWYARATIYALPARYEPFGLTALEAALSGCALVLGDNQSLREVWSDAAAYVPADDPGALRDTLNGLIADPVRRRELAVRARARGRRFGSAEFAESYLQLYRSLLEDTPTCVSYSSATR